MGSSTWPRSNRSTGTTPWSSSLSPSSSRGPSRGSGPRPFGPRLFLPPCCLLDRRREDLLLDQLEGMPEQALASKREVFQQRIRVRDETLAKARRPGPAAALCERHLPSDTRWLLPAAQGKRPVPVDSYPPGEHDAAGIPAAAAGHGDAAGHAPAAGRDEGSPARGMGQAAAPNGKTSPSLQSGFLACPTHIPRFRCIGPCPAAAAGDSRAAADGRDGRVHGRRRGRGQARGSRK